MHFRGGTAPTNIAVDPQEITNIKWNEVEWGKQNGYRARRLPLSQVTTKSCL